jgi:hypothetical protein
MSLLQDVRARKSSSGSHSASRADQMDDYTTLLWAPRCEEVAKLKTSLRALASEAVACAVGEGRALRRRQPCYTRSDKS